MSKEIKPIDILLFCPRCGEQHIDEASPEICELCGHGRSEHFNAGERNICGGGEPGDENDCQCDGFEAWLNPPHKSHRCKFCNHVWRPSDHPTRGVAAIVAKGKAEHSRNARPRYLKTETEINKEDSFYKKLVTRGLENKDTLHAATNISQLLIRLALGQVKYFAEIVHREVFPKMTAEEAEWAAAFFHRVGVYFERVAEDKTDLSEFLYNTQPIRNWGSNAAYFQGIQQLFCVLSCRQADCGERIGIVKDCWETRRWGCGDQDPFKGAGK
ncbi:MAG: hypothetical protein M3209_09610 [Acidobacteriota bacterium]|nr:hypothetical protein [Acidobacteriota bacterium]